MANNFDLPILDEDPQNILGVSQDADAGEIRSAYLNKIKEYPPEKCPQEFERVRDAYEILSDPRHRARAMLQSANPATSLATLLDNQKQGRQFVGPDVWLAVMREK
jgi:DnaJ-class molecular chaperone